MRNTTTYGHHNCAVASEYTHTPPQFAVAMGAAVTAEDMARVFQELAEVRNMQTQTRQQMAEMRATHEQEMGKMRAAHQKEIAEIHANQRIIFERLERGEGSATAIREEMGTEHRKTKHRLDVMRLHDLKKASEKVFGTAELLERILQYVGTPLGTDFDSQALALKELLQAQRVSRTFKTVMDKSSKIRKMLFFEADGSSGKPVMNALLGQLCAKGTQKNFATYAEKWSRLEDGMYHSATRERPSVDTKQMHVELIFEYDEPTPYLILASTSHTSDEGPRRAFRDEHGSWRRMFITQPPTAFKLGIREYCKFSQRHDHIMDGKIDGTVPIGHVAADLAKTFAESEWMSRRY